jgi:glutaminyl-peptide cyclotransferase
MTKVLFHSAARGLLFLLTLALAGFQPNDAPARLVPEVVSVRAHDPGAFTQGLLLYQGLLYESTGLYGQSSLREVDPQTGEVLRMLEVPDEYFGEGLARVEGKLIQLTWQEQQAFVYDLSTFEPLRSFTYEGEGWGLCFDGENLLMSDGSPTISLRDPKTFELVSQFQVTFRGSPLPMLNELECMGDHLYANVWQTDFIVKIEKATGWVVAVVDASGLLSRAEAAVADVLNGIAYDPENDTFLITGKLWPKLFEVRFVEGE